MDLGLVSSSLVEESFTEFLASSFSESLVSLSFGESVRDGLLLMESSSVFTVTSATFVSFISPESFLMLEKINSGAKDISLRHYLLPKATTTRNTSRNPTTR